MQTFSLDLSKKKSMPYLNTSWSETQQILKILTVHSVSPDETATLLLHLFFLDDDHVALSPCTKPCSFKFSTTCSSSLNEEIPICKFIWMSIQLVDIKSFKRYMHPFKSIWFLTESHTKIFTAEQQNLLSSCFLIKWVTCKLVCRVETREQKS